MQPKLRLIDDDEAGQFVFGLQKQRHQAYRPQRTVRKLMGAKYLR